MKIRPSYLSFAAIFALPLLLFLSAGCGKKAPAAGRIEFSGPPGMEVHCGGRSFKGKSLVLRLRPGKYNFRFSAPGYYSRFSSLSVKARETIKLKVGLEPVVSAVLIDSVPRGAQVKFKGEVRGTAPLVIADLPVGEYSAQLLYQGYAEQQVNWKIVNERPHPRITAHLQMISGTLEIRTVPDGCRVFINGKLTGTAPVTRTLDAGVHKVRVERDGFNPRELQVRITGGKSVVRRVALDSRPGTLRVTSVPSGADVFIESRKVGVTPWMSDSISAGNYKIRIEHAGYDHLERVVSVAPGLVENVDLKMAKSSGSASFVIRPAGVSYLVDGRFCGVVEGTKNSSTGTRTVLIENLSPGSHVLTVTHPQAKPIRRDIKFQVTKGKRYTAKDVVELWVSNCEITFKTGKVERGMIYSEDVSAVFYSPSPGVRYSVPRSFIRKIRYVPVAGKQRVENR